MTDRWRSVCGSLTLTLAVLLLALICLGAALGASLRPRRWCDRAQRHFE